MHPFEIGMTDTASSSRRATQIELCSTADVAPGMAIKVEQSGLELAVFNVDGEFYVTDDHCTHGPGSLSEGFIEGTSSNAISTRDNSISARARSCCRRALFR